MGADHRSYLALWHAKLQQITFAFSFDSDSFGGVRRTAFNGK